MNQLFNLCLSKSRIVAAIAFAIGISGFSIVTNAQGLFSPSAEMIKQACFEMSSSMSEKIKAMKTKIGITKSQESDWMMFVKETADAQQPVRIVCDSYFAPDTEIPGLDAPADQRQKLKKAKAQFMEKIEAMGKDLDDAARKLRISLDDEQVSLFDKELSSR
jgi:hypothetical protein